MFPFRFTPLLYPLFLSLGSHSPITRAAQESKNENDYDYQWQQHIKRHKGLNKGNNNASRKEVVNGKLKQPLRPSPSRQRGKQDNQSEKRAFTLRDLSPAPPNHAPTPREQNGGGWRSYLPEPENVMKAIILTIVASVIASLVMELLAFVIHLTQQVHEKVQKVPKSGKKSPQPSPSAPDALSASLPY